MRCFHDQITSEFIALKQVVPAQREVTGLLVLSHIIFKKGLYIIFKNRKLDKKF